MDYFLQSLIDGASLGSIYALVALAIGLVFGILRLINFTQSDYITYSAYALIVPSAAATPVLFIGNWPAALMLVAVLSIGLLLALATERFAFRSIRNVEPEILLISSFAVSYLLQHVLMAVYSTRPKSIPIGNWLGEPVTFMAFRVPLIQLVTLGVTGAFLTILVLVLRFTEFGIKVRAAAENYRMARLLGVRANVVIAGSFAISGLIGATVALLLVAQTGSLDIFMGVMPVIIAFFATVIGGMGSLVGAVLGGFLVGMVSQLLQAYLPGEAREFRDAFLFAFTILILIVRPNGLIPSSTAGQRT
ncbi:branched-chain amino acid ABC transporter permease [Aminobacter niigataensis]|uniref:branched-chain amino acid ABC transporter permease n=1 Tax=Aminobacter niigataensis TaxID=83265 RepID=UPI0024CCA032|nr:branched-chain amino acid ABC transporter permease [Aminobacter niigataensis]CAI2931830.1 Branched-chain amino acid ABC transporter permease [Aminobacter niigataensis]